MKRYEFYTGKELAERLTPCSCSDCSAFSICQKGGHTCVSAKRAWAFGDIETKPRVHTFKNRKEMEVAWTIYMEESAEVDEYNAWLWEEIEVENKSE